MTPPQQEEQSIRKKEDEPQTTLGNGFLDESRKYWALISGGKDSMTTAHYLASKGCLEGCIFLDTGICSNMTKDFIESIKDYYVETIKTPESYENDIIRKIGFPGYPMHGMTKDHLKGRAIRALKKRHKGEGLVLASGIRRFESAQRKKHAKPLGEWEGVPIVAPLYNWTNDDVWGYIKRHSVALSEAYLLWGVSGECPCGASAQKWERKLLTTRPEFNDVGQMILTLESRYDGIWGNAKPPTEGQASLIPLMCQGDCRP